MQSTSARRGTDSQSSTAFMPVAATLGVAGLLLLAGVARFDEGVVPLPTPKNQRVQGGVAIGSFGQPFAVSNGRSEAGQGASASSRPGVPVVSRDQPVGADVVSGLVSVASRVPEA